MGRAALSEHPTVPASLAGQSFGRSGGARWGLTREAFDAALDASVARAFTGRTPRPADIERFVATLHLEDLALAASCAAGLEPAWDHFVREHRPMLERAAAAIDRTGRAREVADALHADLFGLDAHGGARASLFRYFHGRSSLATWLRAVLSQRYVDELRSTRRLEPLDAIDPAATRADASAGSDRVRFAAAMHTALRGAIAALDPRDRLRLGCYYAQDLTLAAIGRLIGEHEATVSRHLARTRAALDADVRGRLARDHGLDEAAISECIRSAADDAGALDLASLVQGQAAGIGEAAGRKNAARDRSKT